MACEHVHRLMGLYRLGGSIAGAYATRFAAAKGAVATPHFVEESGTVPVML